MIIVLGMECAAQAGRAQSRCHLIRDCRLVSNTSALGHLIHVLLKNHGLSQLAIYPRQEHLEYIFVFLPEVFLENRLLRVIGLLPSPHEVAICSRRVVIPAKRIFTGLLSRGTGNWEVLSQWVNPRVAWLWSKYHCRCHLNTTWGTKC